jgi:hypothetical protein
VVRRFPELHGVETDSRVVAEITRQELGLDLTASPEELRAVFRWPSP